MHLFRSLLTQNVSNEYLIDSTRKLFGVYFFLSRVIIIFHNLFCITFMYNKGIEKRVTGIRQYYNITCL